MDKDEDYYVVTNINKFSKAVRKEAVKVLYKEIPDSDLDEYVTIKQCSSILKKVAHKIDGEFYLNEDMYVELIEEIANQIHQSALSKLASQDIIQCAWDDEKEQMVFWVDNDKDNHP
jgi:hypothetical protein